MKSWLSILSGIVLFFNGYLCVAAEMELSGNFGTSFYVSMVSPSTSDASSVLLHINSREDCIVTATVSAKGWKQNLSVKAFVTSTLEVPIHVASTFSSLQELDSQGELPQSGKAVVVRSTRPISLRCQYHSANDGESFLALPESALGNKYIVSSLPDVSWMYSESASRSYCSIAATKNNTSVTIVLGGSATMKSVGGLISGATKKLVLQAGDVVVVANKATVKEGDISGTIITADQPISVVSGNLCANVPTSTAFCAYVAEMELPTKYWGYSYLIPVNAARTHGSYIKVSSSESTTTLGLDCHKWKVLSKPGGAEGQGWLTAGSLVGAGTAMMISADRPVGVHFYNPGQTFDNVAADPFSMVLCPVEQYNTYYQFSVDLGSASGHKRNVLALIFPYDTLGIIPSDLEVATVESGQLKWLPFVTVFGQGFSGNDAYRCKVDYKNYAYKEVLVTKSGVYALRSARPFMCYTFGDATYSSYGNPAGILNNRKMAERADTVAPTSSVVKTARGYYGLAHDLPEDSSVRSNLFVIQLGAGSTNMKLQAPVDAILNSQDAPWSVQVIDSAMDAVAILEIQDWAGNRLVDTLSYSAAEDHSPILHYFPSLSVCPGSLVLLNPSLRPYRSVEWSTGDIGDTLHWRAKSGASLDVYAKVTTLESRVYYSDTVHLQAYASPAQPILQIQGKMLQAPLQKALLYTWYLNGYFVVSGAEMNSLTILSAGTYKLRVTDTQSGCFTESDEFLVSTVDVTTHANINAIYPQPAHDRLVIDAGDETITELRMSTAIGLEIPLLYTGAGSSRCTIDIRECTPGIYTVTWKQKSQYRQSIVIVY